MQQPKKNFKIVPEKRSARVILPNMLTLIGVCIGLTSIRFALDGRDPNSYSGVFWTLGRYDRAWGPERKIYGKIRYMTSENTAKKFKLDSYLEKYGS